VTQLPRTGTQEFYVSNVHSKANVFAMPKFVPRIAQGRLRDLNLERAKHRLDGQMIEREALAIAEMLSHGAIIEPGPDQFDTETLEVVTGDWTRAR
jgi:hypothetical protein